MATSFRFKIATASLLALSLSTGAAQARETAKACHQKFTAARTAGTLNGQSYKAFKAAQCDTDTAEATTAAHPATESAPAAPAAAPVSTTPAPHASAPATTAAASTTATMPDAISPKYSKESAGKARMHTCLDQYNANKATNANGGLRWIQRGGGYYSTCNAKLKG